MFTSEDMWEAMNKPQDVEGIDYWLKSKVAELRASGKRSFELCRESFTYTGCTAHDIKYSLEKRGFSVKETDHHDFIITFPIPERLK
ncbi:hypothetical protein [Pseudomonas sp.]|uniref:hypothetical protein n=1 Tax=Pseudomonas sp. TaxID=306 RepID=UPI003FD84D6C